MAVRFERLDVEPSIELDGNAASLSCEVQREVDAIWEHERAGGKALFDGDLLSLTSRTGRRWRCEAVSYRRLVAALANPALAKAMNFLALAVTGCVECGGGYVLGRRGAAVLQEPGQWEFVPAGGIGPEDVRAGLVDPVAALTREWSEETGAPFLPVARPRVEGCVISGSVCDLVVGVRMDLEARQLLGYHRRLDDAEYSELAILSIGSLARIRGDMAETSRAIAGSLLDAWA